LKLLVRSTFTIIIALTFSTGLIFGQESTSFIHVGNVNCRCKEHYLDSTENAYNLHYADGWIDESHYVIDISLSEYGFPFLEQVSTRFYWDTVFKLYYITYLLQADGSLKKADTTYPPPTLRLDSLFARLVDVGVFSLPLISTSNLKNSWKSFTLSKQGVLDERDFYIADGNQYLLTYKVGSCYGQYIFDNPDEYSKFYVDNPTFKRQDSIVKALMSGYRYHIP